MSAVETQEVRAVAKWVHTSPRKARLVAEHIRGRSVPEARTVLAFTQRAAAREVEKVLRSAVANAEANHGLLGDDLVVAAAYVDVGPVMKRWRARARGRVARIKKPTCHITVKLVPGAEAAIAPPPAVPESSVEEKTPEPVAAEPKEGKPETEPEAKAETAEKPKSETAPQAEAEAVEKPKPKRTTTRKKKETES
jgi:large subunit ribosomal protein L22